MEDQYNLQQFYAILPNKSQVFMDIKWTPKRVCFCLCPGSWEVQYAMYSWASNREGLRCVSSEPGEEELGLSSVVSGAL